MNRRILILTCILITRLDPVEAVSAQTMDQEYKVKAAFLYNFLKTVTWPDRDETGPYRIGLLGEDRFQDAFDPIKGKTVRDRAVVVQRFSQAEQRTEVLRQCHILFIGASEKETLAQILQAVHGAPVLTVGETGGFLETGGMINFIPGAEKGEFEIHLSVCQAVGLGVSSKLLRIARRVLQDESS